MANKAKSHRAWILAVLGIIVMALMKGHFKGQRNFIVGAVSLYGWKDVVYSLQQRLNMAEKCMFNLPLQNLGTPK